MKGPSLSQLIEYCKALPVEVLGTTFAADLSLTQFKEGLHNVTFLLETGGATNRRFVVRFHPGDSEGRDMVAAEYECLEALKGSCSPRAVYLGKPDFLAASLMIMEYVPGEHRSFDSLSDQEIGVLARTLARLHSRTSAVFSPRPPGFAALSSQREAAERSIQRWTIDRLRDLERTYHEEGIALAEEALDILWGEIERHNGAFQAAADNLCHGEPNPKNVIWNKAGLTLIDWTDWGFGDPADEISFMFAMNNSGEDFQKVFLAEYADERTDVGMATRVRVYILKSRIEDLVWSMQQLEKERLGQHSEFLNQGRETYQEYYRARLGALWNELANYKVF